MLSICENIGVEVGVEFGVSLISGVASGVEDKIDAVGRGVGETFPFGSSLPRVAMSAITTPKTPITKTIASIQGNGLRRGRSSADSDAVCRPGK